MVWQDFFKEEIKKDYYKQLMAFVRKEYKIGVCHPDYDKIWNAFILTPLEKVKVVILGQDPYHNYHQAHGLAFSVLCKELPPSLKNIYQEMEDDLKIKVNQDGNLSYLSEQGVLLLNSILTVEKDKPASHKNLGWEIFTDAIIKKLNQKKEPIVFILWGNFAKSKISLITNPNHYIISSSHPSPFSCNYGFFGSRPFSKTNEFLKKINQKEINWQI